MAGGLRFAGAVMITTGLLLIADCGLALVWEEPVTSYLAHRTQVHLGHELTQEDKLAQADARRVTGRTTALRVRKLARRARRRAQPGHAIGRIKIAKIGASFVMVEGVDTAQLDKGPGHYPTTPFPGEGKRTVAVAGHRTTFLAPFRKLGQLKRGARIVLAMPYATLTYAVTHHRVVLPSQTEVLRDIGRPQLVLTTCDPPFSASHRLVVFARLVGVRQTATPTASG